MSAHRGARAGRPAAGHAAVRLEGIEWNAWLASSIADPALCPLCMRPAIVATRCTNCGAELGGDAGARIWQASLEAAQALRSRERLLRAAPLAPAEVPLAAAARRGATRPFSPSPSPSCTTTARSNASLQSMFAIAGAGLVAVAAIVFTFFNDELAAPPIRNLVVAAMTLLFIGGTCWLARRGSTSSAETVGGLSAVFAGIDVWAIAQMARGAGEAWVLAAVATLLCAAMALLLGRRIGLRSWALVGALGFSLVPAMLGYAAGDPLLAALGHLGTVLVVASQFAWLPRLARKPERALLSAVQLLAAISSIPLLAEGMLSGREPLVGALLLGFAAVGVFAARHSARGFWSVVAGASGAAVLPALAFGARHLDSWQITLVTAGAAAGTVAVVALAPRLRSTSLPLLAYAAVTVPAVFSIPTSVFLSAALLVPGRSDDDLFGSGSSYWSFVANAGILGVGAALAALRTRQSAAAHPSTRLLGACCTVVAVLFALLAILSSVRRLLGLADLANIALDSVVASLLLLIAAAMTLARRVPVLVWRTVVAAAAVPFVSGVITVVEERSGWTALTAACMCVLASTLLRARRPGLGVSLRSAAAAMIVPSLAVLCVCLGAELLSVSASPVVLPVIATLVAVALASSERLFARAEAPARLPRLAFEASTLLTAAITVLLALAREAAGLGTACIVLLLLAAGTAMFARFGARRYGWWLAGASLTGALWCLLGLAGVGVLEAYLLPVGLGVSLLAVCLSLRGSQNVALYSAGLGVAIVPPLAMLGWGGEGTAARGIGLLGASWALSAVAALLRRGAAGRPAEPAQRERSSGSERGGTGRGRGALVALATPTFLAAMVSGLAGAVLAARLGAGGVAFWACLAVSAAGAGVMLVAEVGLRRAVPRLAGSRWLGAPVAVSLAAGCWWAIDRDWTDIWSMWALMVAYLVAMAVVSHRQLAGRGPLIPAALLFAIALVTAIVAWSPRELRVDVFSLPLGMMLTLTGALALATRGREGDAEGLPGAGTRGPRGPRALARWPLGQRGSWPLLGPGITVTVLASILATFTDPQTWRAILVMVIALIAMLVGARLRLAAPFVLGLIVLPIENVFVFAVQIGRGIDSMPWWITLATIGAVLLSIAVISEQRAGAQQGIVARLRDLA